MAPATYSVHRSPCSLLTLHLAYSCTMLTLGEQFGRRERLEAYLLQKERDLMKDPTLARWKGRVGRLTGGALPRRAKRGGGAVTDARGRGRGAVGGPRRVAG
jgi:hypothetical protein